MDFHRLAADSKREWRRPQPSPGWHGTAENSQNPILNAAGTHRAMGT